MPVFWLKPTGIPSITCMWISVHGEKFIGSQLVVSSSIQSSQNSQSSYQLSLPLASLQNQQVISCIRSDEQAGVWKVIVPGEATIRIHGLSNRLTTAPTWERGTRVHHHSLTHHPLVPHTKVGPLSHLQQTITFHHICFTNKQEQTTSVRSSVSYMLTRAIHFHPQAHLMAWAVLAQ